MGSPNEPRLMQHNLTEGSASPKPGLTFFSLILTNFCWSKLQIKYVSKAAE